MKTLQHKFIDLVPDLMEQGVLYISMLYRSAMHKCACGCGREVVTPISPTDWQLYFNGETVSLRPSVGNWKFDCRSHYYITNSMVYFLGPEKEEECKPQGKEQAILPGKKTKKKTKLKIPKLKNLFPAKKKKSKKKKG